MNADQNGKTAKSGYTKTFTKRTKERVQRILLASASRRDYAPRSNHRSRPGRKRDDGRSSSQVNVHADAKPAQKPRNAMV